MKMKTVDNVKLGIFVIGGILFLVLLLYMIGRNQNMFGSNFQLKARFSNVQGLKSGNNVRYSGIEIGTVRSVDILNDTTMEVSMYLENQMKGRIRKDAIVSIGNDGLVGNKVVNILPGLGTAPFAEEGDILTGKKVVDPDDMLSTLASTNDEIAIIASQLRQTVEKINASKGLWTILEDEQLPLEIRSSAGNIRRATSRADQMVSGLQLLVDDVRSGKGSLGKLLVDTGFEKDLHETVLKIKMAGENADSLARHLDLLVNDLSREMNTGSGPVNLLLKDSVSAARIQQSLDNIEKGTDNFNQNMEALKHNFLFRGYFRKQEKKRDKN